MLAGNFIFRSWKEMCSDHADWYPGALKGELHPSQNWACFVRYFKIINWHYFETRVNYPRNSEMTLNFSRQLVFELLIKALFARFDQ